VKIAAKKNAIAIEKIDSSTFMLRPSDSVVVVKPVLMLADLHTPINHHPGWLPCFNRVI
jgi:hypothetical protein